VHVVAIAARDQAFFHFVVEWHIERRLSVGVALEAENRLRNLQQIFFFLALMSAVAANAADVRLGVGRAVKVRVRSRVTGQALGVHLFGRVLRGIEYLARVATACHVVGAGTMTTLTTLLGRTALRVQCGLPVRRLFPSVIDFLVTRLAGLRSHVLGNIFGCTFGCIEGGLPGHGCAGRLNALSRRRRTGLAGSKGGDDEEN